MVKKEYIERNELIAKLSESHVLKDIPYLMTLCKELANSIPAADVIPRKNLGEWKKSRDGICCSICGADAMINVLEHGERWYSGNYLLTNFCPNCGADMSGENNA